MTFVDCMTIHKGMAITWVMPRITRKSVDAIIKVDHRESFSSNVQFKSSHTTNRKLDQRDEFATLSWACKTLRNARRESK